MTTSSNTGQTSTQPFGGWEGQRPKGVVDIAGIERQASYADAVTDVERIDLGGVVIPVSSPVTLVKMRNTCRHQDRIDPPGSDARRAP